MHPAVPRPYYNSLDGLRGIAILLVIACHHFGFIPYLQFGWIGVDLFFVLSGFLITDILLRTKGKKNSLGNFYLRRILRIFPLYYGAVLLFFFLTPLFSELQYQYNYYHDSQSFTWLHLQNFLYITQQKPSDFLLLNHFWSLSVEEQFYLIWPFIVFACKSNKRLATIAIALLALCIAARFGSWLYFGNGYTNFYFQYMTRIDGLCIGSLVAIWKFSELPNLVKKVLRLAAVLLSIHAVTFVISRTLFPQLPNFSLLGYTSISVLFSLLLLALITAKWAGLNRFFEKSLLRSIGRISYSLYVFHWPTLVLFKLYLLPRFTNAGYSYYTSLVTVSILSLAAAVGISILTYQFFEKKILALKDQLTFETIPAFVRRKVLSILGLTNR